MPIRGRTGLALAVVSAGVLLTALDQTMVVTVMPSLMRDLGIPYNRLDDAAWIITGYLLGYTVAMPLFGRIADVRGRRTMYIVGVLIFMVGSTACLLAGALGTLVGARIVQAAGGGALVPVAMAISASMLPPRRRALALGVIGGAAEAGSVLGPLYGAVLSETWGWRTIFLINIPLGLLLIALCFMLVPRDRRRDEAESPAHGSSPAQAPQEADGASGGPTTDGSGEAERRPRLRVVLRGRGIDYLGALLLCATLATLTIGLSGNTREGETPVHIPFVIASAASLVAFVFWERRQARPLIQLDLFRSRPFAAANTANLLQGAALIVGMVEIPLYAYTILGESEVGGGLLLMRLTAMNAVGAVIGGWLGDRIGYRATGVLGFAVAASGYFLISSWPADPSAMTMNRDLIVTGLGLGLVDAPIGASVILSVGPSWAATGAALVTVMRMIGQMVGLAALSSWGMRRFFDLMAGTSIPIQTAGMSDAEYQRLTDAYQTTFETAARTVYSEFFLVAALIGAVAIVPALFFYGNRRRQRRVTPVAQ